MTIHKTCLLFGGVEQLIAGLELQHAKSTLPDVHTWIYDDCYPLNREQNLRLLAQVKKRWEDKITVIHGTENLGIHRAFNHLCSQMPLQPGDLILTVAPDTVPLAHDWDGAMARVLNEAPKVAYVGTSSYAIEGTPVNWQPHKTPLTGIKYWVGSGPAMSHATMWRWDFLKAVGGFRQPCAYYGHLETEMWTLARDLGFTHAYLPEYTEDFRLEAYHDDDFRRYKIAQAHTFTFKGSFAEYLEALKRGEIS